MINFPHPFHTAFLQSSVAKCPWVTNRPIVLHSCVTLHTNRKLQSRLKRMQISIYLENVNRKIMHWTGLAVLIWSDSLSKHLLVCISKHLFWQWLKVKYLSLWKSNLWPWPYDRQQDSWLESSLEKQLRKSRTHVGRCHLGRGAVKTKCQQAEHCRPTSIQHLITAEGKK